MSGFPGSSVTSRYSRRRRAGDWRRARSAYKTDGIEIGARTDVLRHYTIISRRVETTSIETTTREAEYHSNNRNT